MPVAIIEVPAGLSLERKSQLIREVNASLASAYSIDENIVFLHEHLRETVGIAGQILASTPSTKSGRAAVAKQASTE